MHKTKLHLDARILDASDMPFLGHIGPGRFDTTLAMNLKVAPILALRNSLAQHLGRDLTCFKAWSSIGEAHITVINPVEYFDILKAHLSMDRINEIAVGENIQVSQFEVLGMGSGRLELSGQIEETFFVIINSDRLTHIRERIHAEYCAAGGDPNDWNPKLWYPHITVGFTVRDFHDTDGVIKTMGQSQDPRFDLVLS